jgi:hypothetical protein
MHQSPDNGIIQSEMDFEDRLSLSPSEDQYFVYNTSSKASIRSYSICRLLPRQISQARHWRWRALFADARASACGFCGDVSESVCASSRVAQTLLLHVAIRLPGRRSEAARPPSRQWRKTRFPRSTNLKIQNFAAQTYATGVTQPLVSILAA